MYCGGWFRDNALVGLLSKMGYATLMIPVYLPLTLEEPDQSQGTPIFFGGISVYLEQKFPWFGRMPRSFHSHAPCLSPFDPGRTGSEPGNTNFFRRHQRLPGTEISMVWPNAALVPSDARCPGSFALGGRVRREDPGRGTGRTDAVDVGG